MGVFARGSVVVIPFPFSDLTQAKMRPAVILAEVGHDDYVLCQVTSRSYSDAIAIKLEVADFDEGRLRVVSYARPGKLFTAAKDLIIKSVGHLNKRTTHQLLQAVRGLFED